MPDDHSSNTQTTGTVAAGGSTTGELESSGDHDWFAVTLEAGTTYRIDLEGSPTGAGDLSDPYLRGVHDANGVLLSRTTNDDGGTGYNSRLVFTPEQGGTYYVAAGAYGSRTGTYRLSVTEVTTSVTDDYEAGTGTSGTVAAGGSATGEVDYASDRDWFAVTLEAGTTYRIDLEGSPTGAGDLSDPYLRGVHDANGVLLSRTTNDDGGTGYNSRLVFTPEQGGTYYVAAGAYGSRTGSYRLSVTDVATGVTDDYEAGTGTSATVAVGGSATGEIESAGDRDWFAVTLEAGTTYRIDLEGSPTGAGDLSDPHLRGVHDANGVLLPGTTDDSGGTGSNSQVSFTPERSGTYYVAAGADGNRTGTYRLSVTEVTTSVTGDYEAGTGTSATVAVGGSATGEIESAGDRDWFAVTLEAGRTYRIDLEGSPTRAGNLSDPYLRGVHDANGVLLSRTTNDDGGTGPNSQVSFTPEQSGTYYVAAGAYGNRTGTYRLSVTEVTTSVTDDYEAGTGTSGTVAVGGSATGEIESAGDRDWFAVTLEADRTYRIDLEGSPTGAGDLSDPYLRGVHDANGVLLSRTTNDDGGTGSNSQVSFTPERSGTYYVAAGADGNRTGTYRLSVTDADDYTAGTGTSGTVAVGGSATGEIESAGDRDWFAVTLEAGRTYRIDLEGSPTRAGDLSDPYLRGVHDANGVLLPGTTDDRGGTGSNSQVLFTPEQSGTYYVAAGADGNRTGTYRLSVTEADDYTAGTGTSATVAVGGSATGEVDYASDRDWFAVTLEAGTTYRIDLEGSTGGGGTLYDPYLRGVYDANGDRLSGTTNDDGGERLNSRLFFTAEQDGTYYVAAGANGNRTGTYRLSVREVTDDSAAGTGTSATVAVGGSTTGELESSGDHDWFAVTLEADRTYRIELDGLAGRRGTLYDPSLRGIHDANGVLLDGTANEDGGLGYNSQVHFGPAQTGTYYVAVAAGANGNGLGTYRLSVTDVTDGSADDYAVWTGTTGTVAVGGSARGEVDYEGDRDWFAVTLEAGTTYRIDLEGSATGAGTARDPELHGVHDANGTLLAGTTNDNDGTGWNSRVFFTPTQAGTYYVAAGSDREGASDYRWRGTYRLSVTEATDDYEAGVGTTATVAVGGSARGAVDTPGDRDWFAVTVEADQHYRIDLESSTGAGGRLYDPYLRGVYDANGDRLSGTTDDNGGGSVIFSLNSRVYFTAGEDGTYYIAAGASGNHTGSYRLSVKEADGAGDDYAAGIGTSGTVAVGGSARGEVETSRDHDWFAVTLEAGTTYRIDLKGAAFEAGTLYDPYLHGIHDASGVLIPGTTDDDDGRGNDSRVYFTADEDGTYYIAAGAHHYFGFHVRGSYTLSVEEGM